MIEVAFGNILPKVILQPRQVVRVDSRAPLGAGALTRSLRQAVDGSIARRDLHLSGGYVERKASDPSNLTGEVELRIALGQGLLGTFALGDVAGHAQQTHGSPLEIAHNRALDRDPARLPRMRVVGWGHNSVFIVPDAASALCLCQGSLYAREVVKVNETSRLFHRHRRHVLPMDLRSTCIALEAAGGKICAECAELGSVKGQPKALPALLERRFTAAPLGE